ncbi:MAG: hypothetical protein K1X94_16985 [Sandaracinaceae bacterium]|nr:hypothetical protein [Sandaracinaceae bacterium]
MTRSFLALFAMLSLATGALVLGACNSQCVNGDCNCVERETCTFNCTRTAGGCSQNCAAGSSCTANCPEGGCSQNCDTGAVCRFTCEGGNCTQNCFASADCTASCTGGSCVGG